MMIGDLKRALENNQFDEIRNIQYECKRVISKKMDNVGPKFEIKKRDLFCEGNHITDTIRNVMFMDQECDKIVAAGR